MKIWVNKHGTKMPKCDRLRMGGNLLPFPVSAMTPRNCPICVAPFNGSKTWHITLYYLVKSGCCEHTLATRYDHFYIKKAGRKLGIRVQTTGKSIPRKLEVSKQSFRSGKL